MPVHSYSDADGVRAAAVLADLADLARTLHATPPAPPIDVLRDLLGRLWPAVPPAHAASVSVCCAGTEGPELVVATDEVPRPDDGAAGVVALSRPLPGPPGVGSLTFFARAPFDAAAGQAASEAAAVCSVVLATLHERIRGDNLEKALVSSRQIAAAVGIVMAQQRCTYEEAFQRIRSVSQRAHRKMRELADEILFTGEVPDGLPAAAPLTGRRVETLDGPTSAQREPAPARRAAGPPPS